MKWLHKFLHHVGYYATKPWYPMLVGFLAFADTFIFVIPTDGLLVSSVMSRPKRAIALTFWTVFGSSLGSVLFAFLVAHGFHFANLSGPAWTQNFFEHYGAWALFVIAALPIAHHPVLVLACFAGTPIFEIAVAMVAGRVVKYGAYAWISTHAPKLLGKIHGMEKEVQEAEAELDLPHVEVEHDKTKKAL